MAVPQGSTGLGEWWWPRTAADRPHARSQFAFLRFVAGMRALLALLGGLALVASSDGASPALPLGVLLYLVLAAALLMRTLDGRAQAMSHLWLWVDAFALAAASHYLKQEAPWLGLASVVPVVAMSLLAGAAHALLLTLFSVTSLLASNQWSGSTGDVPTLSLALPLLVLAIGPTAAFLAQPTREMRRRLGMLEAFTRRSDPRQGLGHHVDVLLELLPLALGQKRPIALDGRTDPRREGDQRRLSGVIPSRDREQVAEPGHGRLVVCRGTTLCFGVRLPHSVRGLGDVIRRPIRQRLRCLDDELRNGRVARDAPGIRERVDRGHLSGGEEPGLSVSGANEALTLRRAP